MSLLILSARSRVNHSSPSDPFFSNVSALMHFEGTNGSTTFTDQIGNTWTRTGSPTISTAQFYFGSSSGTFSSTTSDRIDVTSSAFTFGTSDYTIEGAFRPATTANQALFSFGSLLVYVASSNFAYFNGTNAIIGGTPMANTWVAVALCRAGTTLRLFINGTLIGSITDSTNINTTAMRVGWYNSSNPFTGFADEFRVTKGVARYTSNYTISSGPFPNH